MTHGYVIKDKLTGELFCYVPECEVPVAGGAAKTLAPRELSYDPTKPEQQRIFIVCTPTPLIVDGAIADSYSGIYSLVRRVEMAPTAMNLLRDWPSDRAARLAVGSWLESILKE